MDRVELNQAVLEWQKNQDDETVATVIEAMKPITVALIQRFEYLDEWDELESVCNLAIWESMKVFKLKGGGSFSGWAHFVMRRRLLSKFQVANSQKRTNLDGVISKVCTQSMVTLELSDENHEVVDTIADPTEVLPNDIVESRDSVFERRTKLEENLSDYERLVLSEWVLGKSYKEIASALSERLGRNVDAKSVDNATVRIRMAARKIKAVEAVEASAVPVGCG